MTDNEIIKALECCIKPNCGECPIFYNSEIRKVPGRCVVTLEKDALDLINRQKAELERLQTENRILSQKRMNLFERLEFIHKARAEAVKEFAEKVKSKFCNGYTYLEIGEKAFINGIDNLVKEMVGEQNV